MPGADMRLRRDRLTFALVGAMSLAACDLGTVRKLDPATGKAIIELLRQMNKERGVTVISATHDFKMLDVSDRIVWIRDGGLDRIEKRADVKIATGEIH